MNYQTLHLCNYATTCCISKYVDLVAVNDAIVFYTNTISELQYNALCETFIGQSIYFIIDDNQEKLESIDYLVWVELVNKYNTTMSWK